MSARARILAIGLVVVAVVGVVVLPGGAQATTSTLSRGVAVPAFYTPPATLPAADGAVVRQEPLKLALTLPGLKGALPGRATRLMYKSTDSTGRPVAVTGAYIEPVGRWKGSGPRPLVVVAPGTMGQGDQCSASLGLERGLVVGSDSLSLGYENLAMYRLLAQGIAVVVTDYVGLGATDRLHTYVNRVDEGHAVLDAARAARALPRTSLTPRSPVGLFGYSQGGGAVASAAELQPSYAPDLPLRATYAGAPPANLDDVTAAIDGSELTAALGWSVNGFAQSEPALRPLLDKYLNAAGRAALKDVATMCVGEALTAYAGKRSSAWTTTGSPISDIIRTEPVLRRFVDQQRIGRHRPAGAVLVITSVSDNLVAHPQARTLAVDWCRLGAKVEYRPIFLPKLDSPLVNHFAPVIGAQDTALTWISQRLSGTPAVSNCATMTWQP